MPEYDFYEMSPLLDSSDMTVNEWNRIGRIISDLYEKYDGFVVLHGTDTMAYTASALSFMLENTADTSAKLSPARIISLSALAPPMRLRQSIMIDFPAPVSPESTVKP